MFSIMITLIAYDVGDNNSSCCGDTVCVYNKDGDDYLVDSE